MSAEFAASVTTGPPVEADLARLYDQTAAHVYGMVLHLVRDRSLAESITRDAFLRAWDEQCEGLSVSTVAGRLLVSAHRHAVDHLRTRPAPAPAPAPPDVAPASALDRLTPPERRAVELAYLGGRTHSEVTALSADGAPDARVLIRDGLRRLLPSLPAIA